MSTWQRISGLLQAPESQVQRASGFLQGAKVVARLEFDPQEADSLWLCVAVDEEARVAVLADDDQSLVAGPPLRELALALAQECQAAVTFDRETAHGDDEPGEEDPFDPQIGIVVVAERAVVRTAGDLESLEELATRAQTPLLAAGDEHGYVLLIQDGPAVAELPLEEMHRPVVVLQHAGDYPALSVVNGAEEYQHVWGLRDEVVPAGSPRAAEFADETLGLGLLAELVRSALPHMSTDQVHTALTESSDAPGAIEALGLSLGLAGQVREFLLGQRPAEDVDGAFDVEPLSVGESVRRRAQAAADDARKAAGHAADDTRRRAQDAVDDARRIAEDAWRRTDDAWRWADDVWRRAEHPNWQAANADSREELLQQSVPYLAGATQTVLAAVTWRAAGRRRRRGAPATARDKALRVVSVLLWAAAAANVTAATAYRLRRRD